MVTHSQEGKGFFTLRCDPGEVCFRLLACRAMRKALSTCWAPTLYVKVALWTHQCQAPTTSTTGFLWKSSVTRVALFSVLPQLS
jgi:hypothetical protein